MSGMCAVMRYIIAADELFRQTIQATYLRMDFKTF